AAGGLLDDARAGPRTEAVADQRLAQARFADALRDLQGADVRRLREHLRRCEPLGFVGVVDDVLAELVAAVFAKDAIRRGELARVERGGERRDLEDGRGLERLG